MKRTITVARAESPDPRSREYREADVLAIRNHYALRDIAMDTLVFTSPIPKELAPALLTSPLTGNELMVVNANIDRVDKIILAKLGANILGKSYEDPR